MRHNNLNKTFIIFALVAFGLTSCKQVGSLAKEANKSLNDTHQSDGSSQNKSLDTNVAQATVGGGDLSKQADSEQEKAKTEPAQDSANKPLIEEITKKITEEQGALKTNTDPSDQYGMKTDVFAKLQNKENTKKYSEEANENLRKQFYASLKSDKKTIEDFGKIVIQIEKDSANKGTWTQDLIDAGYKLQAGLETLINEIDPKKEKLNTLASEKMTELKAKFDEIATLKENWIKFVQEVTKDHAADKESIKGDVKKLVGYMDPKFKSIKEGLAKIEKTNKDAKAILDEIKE